MKVCYFGTYDANAARNQIIMKGLRENGVEVIECRSARLGAEKYFELIRAHWAIRNSYDLIIVGFPGYKALILAKLLTRKPVVFDIFVSMYDSIVSDRRQVRQKSLSALYFWITDWLACRLADLVLLDTGAHIDYFVNEFALPREKFRRVLIGANGDVFYPLKEKEYREHFTVHFHGNFIPLQGIEYILDAAKELSDENIKFVILGSGQMYKRMRRHAKERGVLNAAFVGRQPYEQINQYINGADISLGIFGNTPKARRVIPNKVYEALAAGVPVITGDSPAVREVFVPGEHLLVCRMADAKDLARKIRVLKDDPDLRRRLAERGRQHFLEVATPERIGAELLSDIRNRFHFHEYAS